MIHDLSNISYQWNRPETVLMFKRTCTTRIYNIKHKDHEHSCINIPSYNSSKPVTQRYWYHWSNVTCKVCSKNVDFNKSVAKEKSSFQYPNLSLLKFKHFIEQNGILFDEIMILEGCWAGAQQGENLMLSDFVNKHAFVKFYRCCYNNCNKECGPRLRKQETTTQTKTGNITNSVVRLNITSFSLIPVYCSKLYILQSQKHLTNSITLRS